MAKMPYCRHYPEYVSDVVKKSLKQPKTVQNHEYSEIEAIASALIDKGDYVYPGLAEDICRDYAPSKFSHPYKYKAFSPSEDNTLAIEWKKFLELLEYRDSLLKAEDFETDCSITFLNFATAIDFFNDENLVAAYRQDMEKPLRDLWFTYAEGLMAGMHDGHHDSKEKRRMQIYQESLNKLDDDTGMLSDKDLNAVDSTNYQHYAPHQKEMLNAAPGVHLRNG